MAAVAETATRAPAICGVRSSAKLFMAVCPALLYWPTQIVILAQRERMEDDPILFALPRPRELRLRAVILGAIGAGSLL